MKNKIGIILYILYLAQDFFHLKISYLEQLQSIELYKKWSGLVLFLIIISQWYISVLRADNMVLSSKKEFYLTVHKWIGVFLPLFFYIHSTSFGYGMLFILGVVFFINILMGFLNTDQIAVRYPQFFKWWLLFHITFSALIVILGFVHIWQVFYFN